MLISDLKEYFRKSSSEKCEHPPPRKETRFLGLVAEKQFFGL
jgi:hypothetical protein